jgi:hypothetical protein
MAFSYEQTGTIALTNGSTSVMGEGTNWAVSYPGVLLIVDGKTYPVASIDGGTTLTLVHPYSGETASGVAYTFAPLQPDNYALTKKVNEIIEIAGDLVDASRGPAGPAGPAGPIGPSGDSGLGSIVNLTEYTPQPAGGSGTFLIVPVAQGAPTIALTQSSTVVLPLDKPNAGIGLWINSTTSGYAITLGLTNAPIPQPDVPSEPIDLSGSATLYGDPGSIIRLGISLGGVTGTFVVDTPGTVPVSIETADIINVPVASQWTTGSAGSPYPISGDAVAGTVTLAKAGSNDTGFKNGHVVLNQGSYLTTTPLGLEFPSKGDDATTQTPPSFKLLFKGVVPAGSNEEPLCHLEDYGNGMLSLRAHWGDGAMQAVVQRPGYYEVVVSDSDPALRRFGENQLYAVEWVDDVDGPGGMLYFTVDGQPLGAPKPTEKKLRITTAMALEVNASYGNTSNSVDNLEVEYVGISYGRPVTELSYETVTDGQTLTAEQLERLVVDARNMSASTTEHPITYSRGGQAYDLAIIIGEMQLPAGRAYKAVLEDWSTGDGVPHPNELVMTKPAAQNCKFEDAALFSSQASWTEVLPKGPVPSINGIAYHCEGVRMGTYVQFQFAYELDRPEAPFGDPTGLETYMVPHKWLIYDNAGTLLARIEKPNGEPLNSASSKACWEGSYDGRGVPIITDANPWYPHGTVRSSIIWRSHDPIAYSQAQVLNTVPVFDMRVPFASHTGFSVNGFDLRVGQGGAGGDGQMNGFANFRAMSWEPTTYVGIQAQAAATKHPWKALFSTSDAVVPNAAIWLKYTPFNQQGRSPITGPGGTRDDRQIMAEPVAQYVRDITSVRPHDQRSMKEIALHYLTGYASDAIHGIENGRNVPLFKGSPRRAITMRNHYYGGGEATTPTDKAFYVQLGRLSDWIDGGNPLRPKRPYAAKDVGKPYFGTNAIDEAHAHQFPHWGSLLFQTPEFAFLGHRFFDQPRLYNNTILNSQWGPYEVGERGAAWKFAHAALAWKTASPNSQRLYSRAEVLDWVIVDFERFYDQWYAADPGILNPPSSIGSGGSLDGNKALLAAMARFGPCSFNESGVYAHDFYIGYWLSALHTGERLGFNAAVRAASPKAEAVLNWLVTGHQKRVTQRINDGFRINAMSGTDYLCPIWTTAQINTAKGAVSALPQTYGDVQASQGAGAADSWDTFKWQGNNALSRDGQAIDQLLAGPGLLLDMGRTDAALVAAAATAEARFQEKLTSETARGAMEAGTVWFKYHQSTNNRPYRP